MTKVLVCWEDHLHEELDRALRRALRHCALPSPELFFDTSRGYGGFPPYIERDWPRIARHGTPKSRGPIDRLVCVADADRAHECCPRVANPAMIQGSTDAWLAEANEAWTLALRAAATVAPERIAGRFLRWNQESLLIAAHDVEGALRCLGHRDRGALAKHLRDKKPSPLGTPDDNFVHAYRKTGRCFEEMQKAGGAPPHKKGAQPRDDALEEASKHAMARLCARVPDLATLARLVSGMSDDTAT